MKKIVLSILMFSSVGLCNGTLVVGTPATNPAAGATLVTTGALTSGGSTGGWYTVGIWCSSTVLAICNVEFFDGSTVQNTIGIPVVANVLNGWVSGPISFFILDGWTIRIKNKNLALGDVQATIAYDTTALN